MEEDEWLDLVDEHDHVIGKKLRSEVYAEGLRNFRAVELFIVNSRGELWIPRRTATKKLKPLALDFSCAGHVSSGETYEESLHREVAEELNLDLADFSVEYRGTLTPSDHHPCFARIYEIRSDEVPTYNPDDFCEYYWLAPESLLQRIAEGDRAKRGLPIAVKKFYLDSKS